MKRGRTTFPRASEPRSDERYKGEAIARAARALSLFSPAAPRRTLDELTAQTDVPRATLLGILNTLVRHDLLTWDESDGRYRLGPAWLHLADIRRNQLNIRESALPVMRRIRDAVNETVILSLRVGDRRVHLDYAESAQPIRRITQPGNEGPLHVGAAGLVLLAGLSDAEADAYFARAGLDPARGEIADSLAKIRRDGYATVVGTVNPHTAAVAAPVRSYTGETIAALTVSCPRDRFAGNLRRTCARLVVEGAQALSRALGYRP